MSDKKFRQDRRQALEEIKSALLQQLQDLAQGVGRTYDAVKADLPTTLQVQEIFRANALALAVTEDLLNDRPLKEVFARASRKPLPSDLVSTEDAQKDGRAAAFEEVLRALAIAERDFELGYKPLDRDGISYWQKKHPLQPEYLEIAHKENQRHFMRLSLDETRTTVVRAQKPKNPNP